MLAIGKSSKKLASNLTRPFDFYNTALRIVTFCANMVRCGTVIGRFGPVESRHALSILDTPDSLLSCREPHVTPS
jgi:hypothetical protein